MRYLLLLFLVNLVYSYNYISFNINFNIKRSIDDTIIRFVKIDNINNYIIKNTTKSLLIKYNKINNNNINNINNNNKIITTIHNMPILLRDDKDKIINYYKNHLYDEIENESAKYNYTIYNYIKNNNKPIIIISNTNTNKYTYIINNKNNVICKFRFTYNNTNYKYIIDMSLKEINTAETYLSINTHVNYVKNFKLLNLYIKNWIEGIINTNIKNYYMKKYLINTYFLNIT